MKSPVATICELSEHDVELGNDVKPHIAKHR